jgi:hypothetical protein
VLNSNAAGAPAAVALQGIGTTPATTIPTITTVKPSAVQSSAAVGGGTVSDNGGTAMSERGVCWSTSPNPTIDDDCKTETVTDSGVGSFALRISQLRSSNKYHVRAFATNSTGTGYGADVMFTTRMYFYLNAVPAISQGVKSQ